MPFRDEREAIALLKQGDISGLEVLVQIYQVKAIRSAYLIIHDHHLAEDIVQAAFVRAYERRDQFDSERPFRPWFFRIVANGAVKAARRRLREVSMFRASDQEVSRLVDLLADPAPTPEEQIEKSETRETVLWALGRLSPRQRAAVVLRYYLGLKEVDVAERLGRTPGTAKRLLHTARKRLRSLLISER